MPVLYIQTAAIIHDAEKLASMAQLDTHLTGGQGGRRLDPAEVGNILSWRLVMKYFLLSFSPFR